MFTQRGGVALPSHRRVPCWTIIQPADEIPGVWTAHCLELDVVTQGDSPEHALEMAQEAACMVLFDDLVRGEEPTARRAPDEEWERLTRILHEGKRVRMDQVPEELEAVAETATSVMIAAPFVLLVDELPAPGTEHSAALDRASDAPFYFLPSTEDPRLAC